MQDKSKTNKNQKINPQHSSKIKLEIDCFIEGPGKEGDMAASATTTQESNNK